ncbi:ssk1 response regulator receiver [Tulasnella sp. 403]|nr:ssk1 response regulator receiver [Tulasnella sp. 403]
MPKTSPRTETPVDIITQQPVLAPSSTFQLTWPAGEDPPIHSIPSAPQAILDFSQHTPPSTNPFFDTIPMSQDDNAAEAKASSPDDNLSVRSDEEPRSRPPPRFSRAFSAPLPAQLKHLRHPSRKDVNDAPASVVVAARRSFPPPPPVTNHLHELALELADSVQMVIQTLINVTPPHVLDPAKEQLAGCTLQLPTPSVAALLTTMKNLNYMSANLSAFSTPERTPELEILPEETLQTEADLHSPSPPIQAYGLAGDGEQILATNPSSLASDDFDIGEVLQSVGDVLSGMAAEAGVDLVLFHSDVGMKHVHVRGDECGISYALCHVIRQIIMASRPRDEIEVGLYISSPNAARFLKEDAATSDITSPATSVDSDDPLMCTVEITHKFASPSLPQDDGPPPEPSEPRPHPEFNTLILRRLLRHVRATLQTDVTPSSASSPRSSRTVEFSVLLSPGSATPELLPLVDDDPKSKHDGSVAGEPTLDELASFVASDADDGRGGLKGKKAVFHACESSSFAHHLTSYLTAWGMDVSHISFHGDGAENDNWDASDESEDAVSNRTGSVSSRSRSRAGSDVQTPVSPISEAPPLPRTSSADSGRTETPKSTPKSERPDAPGSAKRDPLEVETTEAPTGTESRELAGTSFIIIDDDVNILRRRLAQIRRLAEARLKPTSLPQTVKSVKKRPSLHHRPRSSPSIRLAAVAHPSIPGTIEESSLETDDTKCDFDPLQVVVVHFTSLAKYKTVQDTIQATLYTDTVASTPSGTWNIASVIPDVLVIPKPAGPRRFLTALHTAVRKPYVDPYFAPIATTPMSPTGQHRVGPWTFADGPPRTPGATADAVPESGSRLVVARQSSSGSATSNPSSVSSVSSRLPTLGLVGDRHSPKDYPAEQERHHSNGPVQAVPMTYSGQGHFYTPHPPSPLSREAVEYFSVDAGQIADSAGVLVHSPDGKLAGIFFQPQHPPKDARRGSSATSVTSDPTGDARSTAMSRQGRSNSTMGIDSAIANITPLGTPGAVVPTPGRFRAGSDTQPPNAPPRASPTSPTSPRRSPTNGEDPGRPPIVRVPSNRLVLPVATKELLARRKTSASGQPETAPKSLGQAGETIQRPARPSLADVSGSSPRASISDTPQRVSPGIGPSPSRKAGTGRKLSAEAREKAALISPLKKVKAGADGSIVPPINVLIVEDNPINQTILTTFMKRKRINYGTAKNGQEAIDQWRSGNYHLILMDIQMPVKDGIEATKEIRAIERNIGTFPSTPPLEVAESLKTSNSAPHSPYRSSVIIVALTASSLKSDRVAALAAGCNDFLTKPVSMNWLNTKIIEWGSIKALEMFQDPATARSFTSQNAKSRFVASQLKLPSSRASSPGPAEKPTGRPTLQLQPPSTPEIPIVKTLKPDKLIEPSEGDPSREAEESLLSPLVSPRIPTSSVSGEDALRRHIEVAAKEEAKLNDPSPNAPPVILGEAAKSSGSSSTSIESVLDGIPPIAEDAVKPDVQTPAIPMAPPSAGPSEPVAAEVRRDWGP